MKDHEEAKVLMGPWGAGGGSSPQWDGPEVVKMSASKLKSSAQLQNKHFLGQPKPELTPAHTPARGPGQSSQRKDEGN